MKGFIQVSSAEFMNYVLGFDDELHIIDKYDTNPPLICYMLRSLQDSMRVAYIENHQSNFGSKPNRYFINTNLSAKNAKRK